MCDSRHARGKVLRRPARHHILELNRSPGNDRPRAVFWRKPPERALPCAPVEPLVRRIWVIVISLSTIGGEDGGVAMDGERAHEIAAILDREFITRYCIGHGTRADDDVADHAGDRGPHRNIFVRYSVGPEFEAVTTPILALAADYN